MKILCCDGTSSIKNIFNTLNRMNVNVDIYPQKQVDVFLNEKEVNKLIQYIKGHEITHVISIHLIDNLAVATYRTGTKYLSIIWDAPYHKIFSKYGRMPQCWFSVFDKVDCQRFLNGKIEHVCYQPLSVDESVIQEWDKECDAKICNGYINDICFVGNLYDDNFYDEFCQNLPHTLQIYFTNVFENAAFRWDGINRIYGAVSNELITYIRKTTPGFQMVNFFEIEDARFFESAFLIRKLANIERICVLNLLAETHEVTLYTTSKTANENLSNVKILPPVNAGKDAHYVFRTSKINLNISLKGIEGGTPQRVMDIMGAGGFVMTNFCPETSELFEEDKEIVMFRTPEELIEKVDYYLTHDEERESIAKAGKEKVLNCYTYEKKLKQLIEWVG